MHPILEKKRNHLKELREKERGKWENPDDIIPEVKEEASMPIRRRDDYDDLSDEELEALMAENELIDVPDNINNEEAPKKKVVKKVVKKAPEKAEPKKEEKPQATKGLEDLPDNFEDLSDEELDALLGLNAGGDFNAADLAGIDDVEDSNTKTIAKTSKEDFEAKKAKDTEAIEEEKPKKKAKAKEEPKDDFDSFMDSIPEKEESDEPKPEISVDALNEAIDDNQDTLKQDKQEEINNIVEDIPNEVEVYPEEASEDDEFSEFLDSVPTKEEEALKEVKEDPKPKVEAKNTDRDEFADIVHSKPKNDEEDDTDFENMSDEELEALMAQNDLDF